VDVELDEHRHLSKDLGFYKNLENYFREIYRAEHTLWKIIAENKFFIFVKHTYNSSSPASTMTVKGVSSVKSKSVISKEDMKEIYGA